MGMRSGCIALVASLLLLPQSQPAFIAPNYVRIDAMAECRTLKCAEGYRASVNGKLERLVLGLQLLMLDPSSRTASLDLLTNLPSTEKEEAEIFTLPDWHEGATTSVAQMKRLDRLYETWPRSLAGAALRFPQYLPAYIRYGRLAVLDSHSDYTGYEQKVCRANPNRFATAFRSLDADDQTYARRYVFDPDSCKPIFLSEAE